MRGHASILPLVAVCAATVCSSYFDITTKLNILPSCDKRGAAAKHLCRTARRPGMAVNVQDSFGEIAAEEKLTRRTPKHGALSLPRRPG